MDHFTVNVHRSAHLFSLEHSSLEHREHSVGTQFRSISVADVALPELPFVFTKVRKLLNVNDVNKCDSESEVKN